MSNPPLSPELRQLHGKWCADTLCIDGHNTVADRPCDYWLAFKRAHDLGVKAGLGKAADLAQERAHGHEGSLAAWGDDIDAATNEWLRGKARAARDIEARIRRLADPAPDLITCPTCGGLADNGHDRLCARCHEEYHAD